MSKELKYKAGDKLLLEVVVTEVDKQCDDILPYKVEPVNATDDRFVWVNEDELFQQLEAIPAPQSQTIDRAQLAGEIFVEMWKENIKDAREARDMTYEDVAAQAVKATDAIISELNKNSK